jgi:hypothetical protein
MYRKSSVADCGHTIKESEKGETGPHPEREKRELYDGRMHALEIDSNRGKTQTSVYCR